MSGTYTYGLIGLTEENVGIDRRFYTGLTNAANNAPTLAVSYNAGRVDVFLNGIKLVGNHSGNTNFDYTMDSATGTGSTVTLTTGVAFVASDVVECVGYVSNSSNTITSYNPTPANADGGWNVFTSINHTASDLVNVFLNGVLLDDSDYTLDATNNKVTILGATLTANDVVVIQVIGALDHSNFVPASGGAFTGDVTFSDNNILGVGDIAVDTISSDDGNDIRVTLGTNADCDFNVGTGKLLVEGDNGNIQFSGNGTGTDDSAMFTKGSGTYYLTIGGTAVTSQYKLRFCNWNGIVGGIKTLTNSTIVQVNKSGSSGGGIDFSGAETAANILNDYEESTGTVELYDAATGTTNDLGGGNYIMTKIGNVAHIKLALTMSSNSPSNNIYVTLPITNSTNDLVGGAGNLLFGGDDTENAELISIVCASGNSRARIQSYSGGNHSTATKYFNACLTFVGLT